MPSDAVLHQAAALCLTYPDDAFRARLPLLREAAPQLREFTDHAAVTPALELAAHYVRVFDSGDRCSLRLSRWQDADTRRRGMTPARFGDVYRAAGLEMTDGEPPDFLPAVLEFTARTGDTGLLAGHRAGLERLRTALTDLGTPYATVLTAVCATLPAPGSATTGATAGTTPVAGARGTARPATSDPRPPDDGPRHPSGR